MSDQRGVGLTLASELISCRNARIAKGEIVRNISIAVQELFAGLELSEGPNLHLRAVEYNNNIGVTAVVQKSCPQVQGVAKRRVSISLVDWHRIDTNLDNGMTS